MYLCTVHMAAECKPGMDSAERERLDSESAPCAASWGKELNGEIFLLCSMSGVDVNLQPPASACVSGGARVTVEHETVRKFGAAPNPAYHSMCKAEIFSHSPSLSFPYPQTI